MSESTRIPLNDFQLAMRQWASPAPYNCGALLPSTFRLSSWSRKSQKN